MSEGTSSPPTRRWRSWRPFGAQTSNVLLALALLAALAVFLSEMNRHYAIGRWLVWHYLGVGTLSLLWAASCLAGGYFLIDRLRIRVGTASAEAVLAFPLGVFAFQTAIFLLGLLHLLGVATFVLLPAAFFFAGARRLGGAVRQAAAATPATTLPQVLVVLFGVAGAALVYFPIMSPESFSWDARWYHLPIGQQYALQGAVKAFPEGWWLAGYPHSASLLYTWAFMLPVGVLFDRLELCAHLEFVVFIATIASIPTLVRALAPGVRAQGTWAAFFLFPAIFLYDGSLCAGADHIAALWCIPIALTLIRLWSSWDRRNALLFGVFMAAAIVSKFSAWSMLVLPGLLFVVRAAWLAAANLARGTRVASTGDSGPASAADGRAGTPAVLSPFLVGGGAMLLFSAQYWLRNWIWYGDPLYPVLNEVVKSHPWSAESSASYRLFKSFTSPPAAGAQGWKDALTNTITFSFKPNDWPVFHRDVPVFGSLFTLSMLCLPFIRASARLWLTYLGALVAIVAWYMTSHQDRYLQTWLPVMVACTVATLALVWGRRNHLLRALVVALVGAQIIWGGDVPFFPTHNLIHGSPIQAVSNFLASGFLGTPNRFRLYGDDGLVAEHLPADAILLVHEANPQVGFGVRMVNDQWQGRLSYATLSPSQIFSELSDMKVTHIGWQQTMSGWNSVGSDLSFLGFALNSAASPVILGIYSLAPFPTHPRAANFNDRVAMLTCGNPYPNGLYRVSKLIVPNPGTPWAAPEAPLPDLAAAIAQVGFVVLDPGCAPPLPPEWQTQFHPPLSRGPWRLYVRRLPPT